MVDLIKIWALTYLLTRPAIILLLVCVFTLLMLLAAVFVKFKNGWLSLSCFLILELVGVIAIYTLACPVHHTDDLHLKAAELQAISDVKPEGIVIQRRFRQQVVPLLGIELPSETSEYFQSAKDCILDSRFSGKLRLQRSSAYSGVVLYDASDSSINETLLSDGLAYCSGVAPKQYLIIQKKATRAKRGMWSLPVVQYPSQSHTLREGVIIWLVFIESCSLSVLMLVLWERKRKPA